jgi:hypothetical protein
MPFRIAALILEFHDSIEQRSPIFQQKPTTMTKHYAKEKVSEKTKEEAMHVARATQRPGQTKEQTRLIAQGIQKGIDLYKKQQKERAREQDKQTKKAAVKRVATEMPDDNHVAPIAGNRRLPWILLGLSWLGFAGYVVVSKLT